VHVGDATQPAALIQRPAWRRAPRGFRRWRAFADKPNDSQVAPIFVRSCAVSVHPRQMRNHVSEPAKGFEVCPGLVAYVEAVLGPCHLIGDRSWGHGKSTVIEVRDRDGVHWFAKSHRDKSSYRRELAAYRHWTRALGTHAPTLRAHDDELATLVLSAAPGGFNSGLASGLEPEIQHRAGALLRRFHDVEPPTLWEDFAAEKLDEFERWAAQSDSLLERRHLDFARTEVRDLAGLPTPRRVPCHLDYSPRNWLVADGHIHVIDFEWAEPEVWVNDLSRLYFGPWRDRPDLKDAFLDGYGQMIDEGDRAVLLGCAALTAVFLVAWAHAHRDAPFEEAWRQNLTGLMAGAF
jgi:hypothetical protein